ncbi:MAG: Mor transcription activator family protein [bacterium]|nr:Mor transcription activator family protein [bacterium]
MLEELVSILGQEGALKLIQRFGGTALYIPHNPPQNHALSLVLGPEGAARLASYYGGENLYLPLGRQWLREQQRRMIHDLKAQAVPNNQIAQRIGCTSRWVRMVIRDYPPVEATGL